MHPSIAAPVTLPPNVALAHEWIAPTGGSEKVLDVLADMAPGAPIYCLWDDAPAGSRASDCRELDEPDLAQAGQGRGSAAHVVHMAQAGSP